MTAAERIAEALEEHNNAWNWGSGWLCDCGAAVSTAGGGMAKHQAEVIVGLSGMAVVELPKPDEYTGRFSTGTLDQVGTQPVTDKPGDLGIFYVGHPGRYAMIHPRSVVQVAAALLAAARATEEST